MSQDPLGGLLGGLLGGGQGAGGGGIGQLIQSALKMFMGNQGGQANLNGFLDQMKGAGLGDAVDSWVGTGDNVNVDAKQITQALGPEKVHELAQQAGMSDEDAAKDLSQYLPQVVNEMTPKGKLPDPAAWQQQYGAIFDK